VSDPKVLVCDEPTGDLDRETSQSILGLLQQLNREHGKTMVTHDPRAASYATRQLFVDNGELVNARTVVAA
jgi:putative ABC transport system ATP-binding protein